MLAITLLAGTAWFGQAPATAEGERGTPATSAARGTLNSPNDRCHSAGSARVIKGASKWRDPNTLTRRQAAARETDGSRILDNSGIRTATRPNGSVTISVHFHGITNQDGDGFVSKARIHKQIKVLNDAYGGRTGPEAAKTPPVQDRLD